MKWAPAAGWSMVSVCAFPAPTARWEYAPVVAQPSAP